MGARVQALTLAGPDTDADNPHQPDEELGTDVDLSTINPAVIAALWQALGELLPADSDLRADYAGLAEHFDWWRVPTASSPARSVKAKPD